MTANTSNPSQWQHQWYPVAYLRDLELKKPTRFQLLGEPLVLWFDRIQNHWRAFSDRCPHRLASLSEGRLNNSGELECPYHGWSFSGDGNCANLPQTLSPIPKNIRSSCKTFATASGQGLLFVFTGDASNANDQSLPLVPVIDEPGWFLQDTFRDLPYDSTTLLENVLDVSHVPFTHHATVGKRTNAGPVELKLLTETWQGFTGLWQEGPRQGKLGPQFTTFKAPALMWHDLTARGFARILTVVYATPTAPGECRIFARFPFLFEKPLTAKLLALRPQWLQHIGNNLVLEDDQIFLHYQERNLEASGGSAELIKACFLPTSADKYVIAFHNWLNNYGGVPFPKSKLPPEANRSALLDRYNSHTLSCKSCSSALKRLETFETWLPWILLTLLFGFVFNQNPSQKILIFVFALFTALFSQKAKSWIKQLKQGNGIPPRNFN
jgi:phenylpropionate dioxygenase-like ring-hydroxylating dioxygenase large terminal subunit